LGVLANLAQFWRLTREVDISALRADFEQPVRVDVLGSEPHMAERLAGLLDPADTAVSLLDRDLAGDLRVGTLADWSETNRGRVDADAYILAIGRSLDPDARRAVSVISQGDAPVLLVHPRNTSDVVLVGVPEERVLSLTPDMPESVVRDQLVASLVAAAPHALLPLARRHPLIREAVAHHLILDAARVNAQFAAISNLPGLIPVVGNLFESVADLLILTKNQVLLVVKLGGLYGRDLELSQQLLVEVAPVVGGAFLWRTTARTLVGLLPGFLGIVPKTLVAYTGTYIVGHMANYYFRYGQEPPAEFVAQVRRDALQLARSSLARFTRKND
jgi:uncharacterized protein (DUF697 family)